jgi:L-lactate dehydrogenase complex protein LldG
MGNSRQSILSRIAGSAQVPPRSGFVNVAAPGPVPMGPAQLVQLLCERLRALSTTCEVAENTVVARLGLVTHLQSQGAQQLLSWAGDQLPAPGILDALDVLGITAVTPRAAQLELAARQIEAIDIGLTGVDAALAATGTLVLGGAPGRPLLASQLARYHIALVPQSRIFADAAAWLAALRQPGGLASSWNHTQITLITGPSQTMDIELTPAVGVHGPRRLHVIIVQGI